MDRALMEVLVMGGIALVSLVHGFAWMRHPRLARLAWPSFGVAGVVTGLLLKRQDLVQWSVALTAVAIVAQILYDGLKRRDENAGVVVGRTKT